MIYLRPSRRIKSAELSDRIVISDSLLDEYLDRLISLNADKRPFNLHLEASNGVVLDEQSTTATELSLRVYTHDGVDITSLVKTLSPSWEIEGKEVGQGLSYTAQATRLKSWHTKITVTTTVARILDAMGKLDKLEQGVRRVLEEQEVKTSIELRKDSILLQHIPTTELIRQSLKEDRQFIASVKGDKGDAGQDAAPVRPNLIRRGESLYPNMGNAADSVEVTYKEGVYRITKRGKMWRSITMYTRPLLPQKSTKTRLASWRVVGASRPELLNEHQIKSKGGRYYTVGNTNHEEQWVRGGVYANPFSGEENHWIDGDWMEFTDLKVELVEEGEPIEPTAYIPHVADLKGDSVTALQVVAELNKTDIFALSVRDALKQDTSFLASVKGDKGDRGLRGLKGEDGKSPTPQEVAGVINTPDWQALLADQTARKVTASDAHLAKIREGMATHDQLDNVAQIGQQAITLAQSVASEEYQSHIINQTLIQMDDKTQKLIQKYATRSIPSRITPQAGRFNIVRVPNFDDPELTPPIAVGATISLNVFIAPPVGSGCVYGAKTADEHGYFFLLQSSNYIFTTDAQPLGTEVKVYYNSEMCATENLTVRLERAESHWIFLNYYDFGAGVQAKYTKTRLQSHYSNNSQSQSLEYAPFQYLSGTKRDVYLPLPITGLTIKVWANFWVGDVTVRATNGVSLHDTSRGEANNVGNTGVTIPKGHIGEFVCLGDIWLYTDLSR